MFRIEVDKLCWINDSADNPEDLCAHGHVTVAIGNETFEEDATVSATAIYLLKSLEQNHYTNEDIQMLPCCGHAMIATDDENVVILGCNNGTDWSVIHQEYNVKLITEKGNETVVPFEEYRKTVFAFADKIEGFYKTCTDKILPEDNFERNGYIAFWNEWKRRRYGK